ncbi:MAG: rhodanese-like domain-containing protein [Parvibaculaceae bacterium]
MSIPVINPTEAKRRIIEGSAVLVDIREPNEHARESIPGAKLIPLSTYTANSLAAYQGKDKPAIIFHCQSGKRTADNADRLSECGIPEVYILEGGVSGWKAAGNKTSIDLTKPIEMQRQVQIAAGSLVLTGLALALVISPWFAALSAFAGAGLVFAGVSGWCGMANLLAFMPWNRKTV